MFCICIYFTIAATVHAAVHCHCKLRRHCDVTIIEKKIDFKLLIIGLLTVNRLTDLFARIDPKSARPIN